MVAGRQFGVASWAQLRRRGIKGPAISRAVDGGWLHEVFPRVYSVVPVPLMTVEAWHAAAILAGRTNACLCASSAGWWTRVLAERPPVIHVAVSCEREPVEGIQWHRLKLADHERGHYRRMPVTAPARVPLDLAADLSLWDLKGVLAELEFHHDIGPDVVRAHLRRGYPGAAKLRRALDEHTPQLAATRSELERVFLRFLTERHFELCDFNYPVGTSTASPATPGSGAFSETIAATSTAAPTASCRSAITTPSCWTLPTGCSSRQSSSASGAGG